MQTIAIEFNASLADLAKVVSDFRIKNHLRRVELALRKSPPRAMTPSLLKTRAKTLDNLRDYWQAGEFPINTQIAARTPVFKDELGNYCAVGYLMSVSGYDSYVSEIQNTNNYIRVNDISDPKYLQAISALGITQDEAARIQPGYPGEFYQAPATSSSDTTLMLLQAISIAVFVLFQLFAIFFLKEMNLGRAQKIFGFLTMFTFSTLVLTLVIAVLNLMNLIS